MRDLVTPLGRYWIDDFSEDDTRVGVHSVELVAARGPESTYRWSLDEEEALFAAAAEVGATLDLLTPGGWRLRPAAALAAFEVALVRRSGTCPQSPRWTPER